MKDNKDISGGQKKKKKKAFMWKHLEKIMSQYSGKRMSQPGCEHQR